jgi:hypothetical protein
MEDKTARQVFAAIIAFPSCPFAVLLGQGATGGGVYAQRGVQRLDPVRYDTRLQVIRTQLPPEGRPTARGSQPASNLSQNLWLIVSLDQSERKGHPLLARPQGRSRAKYETRTV